MEANVLVVTAIEFFADGLLLHAGTMHPNLTAPALPATPAALDLLASLLDFFVCRLVPW